MLHSVIIMLCWLSSRIRASVCCTPGICNMRQQGELLLGCTTNGHSGPWPGVNCCLVVRPMGTLGLVLGWIVAWLYDQWALWALSWGGLLLGCMTNGHSGPNVLGWIVAWLYDQWALWALTWGGLLLGCTTNGHSGPCPGVNCCLVVRPMGTLGLVLGWIVAWLYDQWALWALSRSRLLLGCTTNGHSGPCPGVDCCLVVRPMGTLGLVLGWIVAWLYDQRALWALSWGGLLLGCTTNGHSGPCPGVDCCLVVRPKGTLGLVLGWIVAWLYDQWALWALTWGGLLLGCTTNGHSGPCPGVDCCLVVRPMGTLGLVLGWIVAWLYDQWALWALSRSRLLLGCTTNGHSGPCPGVDCCLVVRPMGTLGLVLGWIVAWLYDQRALWALSWGGLLLGCTTNGHSGPCPGVDCCLVVRPKGTLGLVLGWIVAWLYDQWALWALTWGGLLLGCTTNGHSGPCPGVDCCLVVRPTGTLGLVLGWIVAWLYDQWALWALSWGGLLLGCTTNGHSGPCPGVECCLVVRPMGTLGLVLGWIVAWLYDQRALWALSWGWIVAWLYDQWALWALSWGWIVAWLYDQWALWALSWGGLLLGCTTNGHSGPCPGGGLLLGCTTNGHSGPCPGGGLLLGCTTNGHSGPRPGSDSCSSLCIVHAKKNSLSVDLSFFSNSNWVDCHLAFRRCFENGSSSLLKSSTRLAMVPVFTFITMCLDSLSGVPSFFDRIQVSDNQHFHWFDVFTLAFCGEDRPEFWVIRLMS